MNVSAKTSRSLAALANASSFSRGTRSILLITNIFSRSTAASFLKIASASASRPARASISTQTRSASWAPLQAVDTIARSSRRLGAKIPGVSTRIICAWPSTTMPRISARVVCTLRETIVTLEPTSALTSVDLPTLGAPIRATKPHAVAAGAVPSAGDSVIGAADALARDHRRRRSLLRRALATADTFGRRQSRQFDCDAELRIMMRAGALDFAIDRGRQALSLRPFLQHRLGIAQRPPQDAHPLRPVALDKLRGRLVPAVEEHRADHRLTNIAKHRPAQARAHRCAHRAELDVLGQPEQFGNLSAAFLAYEVSQPLR